jgi:hypothetical protein
MILLAICCCRLNSAPKRFGRGWKRYPKRGAAESKAVTTRRLSQGSASTREPDGTGDQRRCYATPAAFASTVAFPRFSFEGLWRVMKDSPTALSAITDDRGWSSRSCKFLGCYRCRPVSAAHDATAKNRSLQATRGIQWQTQEPRDKPLGVRPVSLSCAARNGLCCIRRPTGAV